MDFNLNDGYVCSWVENIDERETLTEGQALADIIVMLQTGSDGFDFTVEEAIEVASEVLGKPVLYLDFMANLIDICESVSKAENV